MTWILDNLAATCFGAALLAVAAFVGRRLRALYALRNGERSAQRRGPASNDQIIRFLEAEGAHEVYAPSHLADVDSLPVLVHPCFLFEVDIRSANVLFLDSIEVDQLPVDERVVARRRALGTELWNGDVVHAASHDFSTSPPRITLRRSTYFAYVTAVEDVLSATWSRRSSARTRLRAFRTVESAMCSTATRLWLSGATVTLLEEEGQTAKVIIHRRSSRVVNAPGRRTVAPVFGFDASAIGSEVSALGVPLYNLVREYAEELFDKEDFVRANLSNWHHPDQIVSAVPEVNTLLGEIRSGVVHASITGLCVNPRDCDLSVALLLRIPSDSASGSHIKDAMKAGWEAEAGQPGEAAAELVSLDDPRIDVWAATQQLYPTSAFALDRARALIGTTS